MTLPNEMTAIEMAGTGGPEVLKPTTMPVPDLRAHEVLIKVAAAGINGPDLVQRRGNYPAPKGASPLLGLEVSGEIVATGAQAQWSAGTKVCALTNGGGYAEYVAVDGSHCLPVPEGVDLIDAAGLPETYFTVWSNVFHGHDVPDGGNLLVHGGAGGIGSTAIQLGRAMGLSVYTTAGTADDCAFCEALGARHAINFKEEDFVEVVRNAGGADIIIDIIGGDYVARNIKASRHDGRIIHLAFNQGAKMELNLMPMMLKRLSLTGSTLRSRPDSYKADVAKALSQVVWPKFGQGELRPVTDQAIPLTEASLAHTRMEQAAHRGKLLLIP
ncbi:MAG: NAD(P)H-quinone oxidoreductase [Pseudomonadota bacterium]